MSRLELVSELAQIINEVVIGDSIPVSDELKLFVTDWRNIFGVVQLRHDITKLSITICAAYDQVKLDLDKEGVCIHDEVMDHCGSYDLDFIPCLLDSLFEDSCDNIGIFNVDKTLVYSSIMRLVNHGI